MNSRGLVVKYDDSDTQKPGWKFAEYELKGVPVRLAIGPRDLENNTVEIARRDTLEKKIIPMDGLADRCSQPARRDTANMYNKALDFRNKNTFKADTWDEFKDILETKGGFISAHWDGTAETEMKIKDETKATIRCIPLENEPEEGTCIYSGKPSSSGCCLRWRIKK